MTKHRFHIFQNLLIEIQHYSSADSTTPKTGFFFLRVLTPNWDLGAPIQGISWAPFAGLLRSKCGFDPEKERVGMVGYRGQRTHVDSDEMLEVAITAGLLMVEGGGCVDNRVVFEIRPNDWEGIVESGRPWQGTLDLIQAAEWKQRQFRALIELGLN